MLVYWNDGTSLYHYGIPGQKWGVQNRPPYPLGTKQLSSRERHKRYDSSVTSKLSNKSKRLMKIGSAIVLTGLVAYGTYRIGASNVLKSASIGKQVLGNVPSIGEVVNTFIPSNNKQPLIISDSVKKFSEQYDIPLKNHSSTAYDDMLACIEHREADARNDCAAIGITACLRQMGLDVYPEFSTTHLTISDLPNYFKGIKSATKNLMDDLGYGNPLAKSYEESKAYNIIARDKLVKHISELCEGSDRACGIINMYPYSLMGGHLTTWFKENGEIKFIDGQRLASGKEPDIFRADKNGLIDYSMGFGFIEIARLDNLEPNKFILGGNALNPDKKPVIQDYRLNK